MSIEVLTKRQPLTEKSNDQWLFDQLLRIEKDGNIVVSRSENRGIYDVLLSESGSQNMGATEYASMLTGYDCKVTI